MVPLPALAGEEQFMVPAPLAGEEGAVDLAIRLDRIML